MRAFAPRFMVCSPISVENSRGNLPVKPVFKPLSLADKLKVRRKVRVEIADGDGPVNCTEPVSDSSVTLFVPLMLLHVIPSQGFGGPHGLLSAVHDER